MKKRIIGLILILVSVGTLGFWEFWGRENILYEEVLVFKEDAERNTRVTKEMLEIKMTENPASDALRPEDLQQLLSMETTQFVPEKTELYTEYFQDPEFSVGGDSGRYILSIPNAWLQSYPQTLRRGDRVFFYCEGRLVTSAVVAYARDSSNQEVVSADEERLSASSTVSLVEIVVEEGQALQLGKIADEGKQFVLLYN